MIAPAESFAPGLAAKVREIFSPHGPLSGNAHFEFRPQQQQMAEAIARCLSQQRHLLVEAGTGVGKSLAYLVPGVLFALECQKKLIVSTHTIPLQQQLLDKDIPAARKIIGKNFDAALMLGRANYLCQQRLMRALKHQSEIFTTAQAAELARIRAWALTTKTGKLQDLKPEPDPHVWAAVCSERGSCASHLGCRHDTCFYQQARMEMMRADVVVLNHALLMTLLGNAEFHPDQEGYLFGTDFLVVDEAHALEHVAADHIGYQFDEYQLHFDLRRLHNPATKKGLLIKLKAKRALDLLDTTTHAADNFFAEVEHVLPFKDNNEVRIRTPHFVEDTLSTPLAALVCELGELSKTIEDDDVRTELELPQKLLNGHLESLAVILSLRHRDHVYWATRRGTAATPRNLCLQAAPVDLAEPLRRILFRDNAQAILTSATLSPERGNLHYIARRIGAEDAEQLQLDSPFDYKRQMRILIPRGLPDYRDEKYIPAISREILHHVARSDGHAFVLFTNKSDLRQVAERIEMILLARGHPVFIQNCDMQRDEMLQRFKTTPRSVLFGLDSFWAGVDVPGDALTNVIITKLPFLSPNQPQVQARCELIRSRGGDDFLEYSLPEAILKFRQGAGRLIRTARDRGTLVILDRRITKSNYGHKFLAALPACPIENCDPAPQEDFSERTPPQNTSTPTTKRRSIC